MVTTFPKILAKKFASEPKPACANYDV